MAAYSCSSFDFPPTRQTILPSGRSSCSNSPAPATGPSSNVQRMVLPESAFRFMQRRGSTRVPRPCGILRGMYPTLIKIGSIEITTFGLMMFIAFVVAGWVLAKQFRKAGIDEDVASSMVMAAAIGGIVGAKVYYAILFRDWHLLFDRAGLVWYGGLIGGFLACSWLIWRHKVDYLTVADAAAPAISIGYALGR